MNWFQVGKIVNTHGIKGELKVLVTSDFADLRMKPGNQITAYSPDGNQTRALTIRSYRIHKKMYLVTFQGVETMTDAEKLKDWQLKVSEEQLHPLPNGEYYFHEIIGCNVVDEDGQAIGEIESILTPGANHVWVVRTTQKKELLLPVIDEVVLKVDVPQKCVTVRLMEGLI